MENNKIKLKPLNRKPKPTLNEEVINKLHEEVINKLQSIGIDPKKAVEYVMVLIDTDATKFGYKNGDDFAKEILRGYNMNSYNGRSKEVASIVLLNEYKNDEKLFEHLFYESKKVHYAIELGLDPEPYRYDGTSS